MRFKNRWTISSSCDFQAHLPGSQGCHFFQTALQWFEVLPGLSLGLPGAPRLVVGAPRIVIGAPRLVVGAPRLIVGTPRLVACAPRCSWVHLMFSLALRGVLKLNTITPKPLLYQSSEIPVTPKAGRNALLRSDTVLKLTRLCLHSTSSQTLLEASSDRNAICWWKCWCQISVSFFWSEWECRIYEKLYCCGC